MGGMKIQQMGESRPGGGEGLLLYLNEEERTFRGILGLQGRAGGRTCANSFIPMLIFA